MLRFGFYRQLVSPTILHTIQALAFAYFYGGHLYRFAISKKKLTFLSKNWFQTPLIAGLFAFLFYSPQRLVSHDAIEISILVVGVYLIVQVLESLCRFIVAVAATGLNPMRTFALSFMAFIIIGAGFLTLPRFHRCEDLSFLDACFTTTSAVCVTGLVVKDTGSDFTMLGQTLILTLMQLGGLGIVVFGAIFALMFGKAFSVQETVAMQDLLSTETVNKIGKMVGFIFTFTILIESLGAIGLWSMWDMNGGQYDTDQRLFYSIFHSVSAFCNAGFSLFSDSFVKFSGAPQIYFVICPLIIIGGIGFMVLYNLVEIAMEKHKAGFSRYKNPGNLLYSKPFIKASLQTKIVLNSTLILLVTGTIGFLLFSIFAQPNVAELPKVGWFQNILDSFFMSVTCRTAGFNTIDIASLGDGGKILSILLMLIGGSPGSTAGGMKTVTLVVIIMAVWAAITQTAEAEAFRRSIRISIIGRAMTVAFLYITVYLFLVFALCITERNSGFNALDVMFEGASALGTVGLSVGITPELSAGGKVMIILAMLIGRLGPLTILASLMLNVKPVKYSYPDEALIIG